MPSNATSTRRWLLVAALCAIGFTLLMLMVADQGAVGFDAPVIEFVRSLPVGEPVWLALTWAGGGVLVAIDVAVVLGLLLIRRPRTAAVYGVAMAAASIWTHLVKITVARARPAGQALVGASGFSFPSGHSLNSTVTYGLIALLVWRSGLPRWLRLTTAVALAGLVIGVGLSRIALGVHYPSDVLGGWLGGLAIVALVAAVTA